MTGPAKSRNSRNPRNQPPISRNPHGKKRNPTPATKSTAIPPKANYRNPPALDGCVYEWLNYIHDVYGFTTLSCPVVHSPHSTLHSERRHTSKSIRLALIIAYITGVSVASAINRTGTAIEVNS